MCHLCTFNVAAIFGVAIPTYAVADPGGVRGVQMHPPFEGLPLRVLSKSAQT